ncbi:unnamed protein product, partial [Durusdinium trenchii]
LYSGDAFMLVVGRSETKIPLAGHRVLFRKGLAVLLGVQACFGQLVMVLATVCSTWVAVNAGTSRRSILVPQGCVSGTATRKGNKMAVR